MPSLPRPDRPRTLVLPERTGTLAAETDVLVVGGGPGGLGAAIGAADAGADVVLVERYGFLGGNATAALVMPWMSSYTRRDPPVLGEAKPLFPPDHGRGEPLTGGVVTRLVDRLVQSGGAHAPEPATGYVMPFDPESFKAVALQLVHEAGVQFLFHAFASGVEFAGRVDKGSGLRGVVFETKSGPVVVRARVVVDATGDGDVAAAAGAPFEIGREDGLVQPMTLMFRMGQFDGERFLGFAAENPDQWRGVHGLWDLVREAREAGELDLPREDILLFGTPHAREVSVNSTRVTRVRGIDVWDLSRAEWESRRQLRQIVDFLRRRVPGFEQAYLVQSGVQVGVRETRRIVGEYQLQAEDVLTARKFDDVIARCAYPIDIHNPTGQGTRLERVPAGDAYDIPLRCLVPQRVEGLLVAGRCISGTHEAHSSYRVMPTAMATGQAAGVCAALAVAEGVPPRDVPAAAVQEVLGRQGAEVRRPA